MTAGLTLEDETAQRSDLARRGETKFTFDREDAAVVRAVLRRAATPLVYAGPVSVVRSVYFDDAELGACRANLDGLGARNKFRVRWYDRSGQFVPFALVVWLLGYGEAAPEMGCGTGYLFYALLLEGGRF